MGRQYSPEEMAQFRLMQDAAQMPDAWFRGGAFTGGSPTFNEAQYAGQGVPISGPADDWFGQNAPSANTGVAGGAALPNATQWDQSTFTQQFGTPGTPQELAALEPRLNAAGIKVSRNAAGVPGKIILPNGQYVDVIQSAGLGGRGFQWLTGDGGGGAAAGGAGGGVGGLGIGDIGKGLEDTPGYQFRLQQGLQALERSAASRGTLLTGGTLKGLQNYAQGLASTEYGNRVNQLMDLSRLGLGAAGGQAQASSSYGQQATDATTAAGNARSAGTIAQGNAVTGAINTATSLPLQYYYLSQLYGNR